MARCSGCGRWRWARGAVLDDARGRTEPLEADDAQMWADGVHFWLMEEFDTGVLRRGLHDRVETAHEQAAASTVEADGDGDQVQRLAALVAGRSKRIRGHRPPGAAGVRQPQRRQSGPRRSPSWPTRRTQPVCHVRLRTPHHQRWSTRRTLPVIQSGYVRHITGQTPAHPGDTDQHATVSEQRTPALPRKRPGPRNAHLMR